MAAFSRAIRAHRRLAKLAPRLFDGAVINREAAARREELERRRHLEPILNKVYGDPPDTPFPRPNEDWNCPVPKHPRTLRAMEQQLAEWNLWMSVARENMTLFNQRRPHGPLGFNQMARLLDVGFTLKRLACGLDTTSSGTANRRHNKWSRAQS